MECDRGLGGEDVGPGLRDLRRPHEAHGRQQWRPRDHEVVLAQYLVGTSSFPVSPLGPSGVRGTGTDVSCAVVAVSSVGVPRPAHVWGVWVCPDVK